MGCVSVKLVNMDFSDVDVRKSKIKESTSQEGQVLMVTFWYSYMVDR